MREGLLGARVSWMMLAVVALGLAMAQASSECWRRSFGARAQ
jgi:hypothetical protein